MTRPLLLAFVLLAAAIARPSAQLSAQPSSAQALQSLADASSLVVTGRVTGVTAQADGGFIYTYVSVDVDQTLKGALAERALVVKQLGGTLPGLGLYIPDQARFQVGEEVLLFLTVRPRDGTLQTVRLDDGKWRLLPGFQTGGRMAVHGNQQFDLDTLVRPFVAGAQLNDRMFVAVPPEFGAGVSSSYTTIPPGEGGPARWHQADDRQDIRIDYQTGTNMARLNAARDRWNGVGTTLQLGLGGSGGAPTSGCSAFVDSRSIRFFHNDPCGELPDGDPAFFGVGGGFFTPGFQKTVNGTTFNAFVQGLAILNNVGPHTSTDACMEDAIGHVLGHAIGFGHSSDSTALMYPTLRSSCSSGSTGLGTDDIAGLQFMYPDIPSGGQPPHAPTAITNTVALDTVTLSWTPAQTGGPAQRYILEAGSAPGLANIAVLPLNSTATTTNVYAVPQGVYYVRVRAWNVLGTSLPSPDTTVTVGPCQAPTAPTNLAYTTADNLVSITWTPPSSGAVEGYRLYAGFSPGASNALVMDLGTTPGFSGTAPFGQYYVRVAAGNRCSIGVPSTPDLVVNVQPCTPAPNAPTGLTGTVAPNRVVTLSWSNPAAGPMPSRFRILVGSGPGLSNIMVHTTANNATSFVAAAPPGAYYVRVEGQNNCGFSAPSNEFLVNVP